MSADDLTPGQRAARKAVETRRRALDAQAAIRADHRHADATLRPSATGKGWLLFADGVVWSYATKTRALDYARGRFNLTEAR